MKTLGYQYRRSEPPAAGAQASLSCRLCPELCGSLVQGWDQGKVQLIGARSWGTPALFLPPLAPHPVGTGWSSGPGCPHRCCPTTSLKALPTGAWLTGAALSGFLSTALRPDAHCHSCPDLSAAWGLLLATPRLPSARRHLPLSGQAHCHRSGPGHGQSFHVTWLHEPSLYVCLSASRDLLTGS